MRQLIQCRINARASDTWCDCPTVITQNDAGVNTVVWDGTNNKGEYVGSGVYLSTLIVGDKELTKKMILEK